MRLQHHFDPRIFRDDLRGNAARHRVWWNIVCGHGIGRENGAASDDYTFRDCGMCRDPRPPANANRRKIAAAKSVGSIEFCVVPADQNRVRPELHLVLQDDPTPCMQPAARGEEDIAADFQAIRKVDRHMSRHLKISPAAFE